MLMLLALSVGVQAQEEVKSNANKITREQARTIKKQKGDLLESLGKLGQVLEYSNLKPKNRKLAVKLIMMHYQNAITENNDKVLELLRKNGEANDPVMKYRHLTMIVDDYQIRKRLSEVITTAGIELDYIEEPEILRMQIQDYQSFQMEARREASSYLYDKAVPILQDSKSSREQYRQAYGLLSQCVVIDANYKDVVNLKQKALNLSRVDILIAPVISSGTADNGVMAALLTKRFQRYIHHSYKQTNPFIRISTNKTAMRNPDMVFQMEVHSMTIKEKHAKPRSKEMSKTIKDDDGKERKVTASGTIYHKEKHVTTKGIFSMTYQNGEQKSIQQPFDHFYRWQNKFAKYSGDYKALNREFRTLSGRKDERFPAKAETIELAASHFSLTEIKVMIRYLHTLVE